MNQTCVKCGKYTAIVVWHGVVPPPMCDCNSYQVSGWRCPVCGAGNSPWSTQCPCQFREYRVTCDTGTSTRFRFFSGCRTSRHPDDKEKDVASAIRKVFSE